MTFEASRKADIRTPLSIVEIDLDYCSLEYATAPCQAVLGVTGEDRCFNVISKNSKANCQDRANYTKETKTYRFCTATTRPPLNSIPSVLNIDITPTRIGDGSLGRRGNATITFQDHTWHDRGIDKYFDLRSYDPDKQGTFFGKFFARNTFYQNRELRIFEGFINDPFSIGDFQTRTYQIDSMTLPDKNGVFKVVAKDIMKVASSKKSKMPKVTSGELTVAMDAVTTIDISLDDVSGYNDPAVTLETEYIITGSEIFSYTGITGNDLTGVTRSVEGTEKSSHAINDVVQQCKKFDNVPFADALEDALVNYGNVLQVYIPKAAWVAEMLTWLPDLFLNAIITEPEGVNDVVSEWISLFPISIWPDEIEKLIKLDALKPPFTEIVPDLTKDGSIVENSVSIGERTEDRISNIVYYYDIRDPTDDLEKRKNYRRGDDPIDVNAESADEYDERITKIQYCRWLGSAQKGIVQQMTSRELSRFRNNPKFINFTLDIKDMDVWTGDIVSFQSNQLQDADGSYPKIFLKILEAKTLKTGAIKIKAEDLRFEGRFFLVSPSPEFNTIDYAFANDAQKSRYGWIGDAGLINSGFANGDSPYRLI